MRTIKAPHNGMTLAIYGREFTELCEAIHVFNTQWWLDDKGKRKERNVGEMLMLMTSELSEASEKNPEYNALLIEIVNRLSAALEAHRKDLQDDKLPQFHGLDVELIDCIIRCCDLLGARYAARLTASVLPLEAALAGETRPNYSPGDVLEAKCLYNSERLDHRPETRAQSGGKKY